MNIPIIFMHFGNSWYLPSVLKCAKKFNPNTRIILLGDDENKKIAYDLNITFKYYEGYGEGDKFNDLKNNYNHIGSAPIHAHRKHHFNIMRWPRLFHLMKCHNIKSCWYFDSDTLICRNLEEIKLTDHLYTINHISGCAMYINRLPFIETLCNTIYKYRKDIDFIKYHEKMIWKRKEEGKLYNLCDMSYIGKFKEEYKLYSKDLAWPRYTMKEPNPSIFDWNISTSIADQIKDFPFIFKMKNGKKKIIFIDKIPYFEKENNGLMRANTINMSWVDQTFFKEVLKNIGI